jgi:4-hydroxybenzoate polyprenyltransferase
LHILGVFIAGTVGMRSAGCVLNDFADRAIDGQVKRTRDRPLARGEVSPAEALVLSAFLVLVCACLVLSLNRLTFYLSFVAVVLAGIYPFMKRYTYVPQIFLGAAFGWGVPMAFAPATDSVPPIAWAMTASAFLWAMIYDTQYAMVDREDDLKIGVKSTAILFGDADTTFIAGFQILMLAGLALIGRDAHLGWTYTVALSICCALAVYQQWLIREREPAGCFAAFMNNNWYGGAVFAGIAAHYALAV